MKHRIARVRFTGKWVEVWFGDEYVEGSEYSASCKDYMLEAAVEEADLWDRVNNHGYVGLWITWDDGEREPTGIEAEGRSEERKRTAKATMFHQFMDAIARGGAWTNEDDLPEELAGRLIDKLDDRSTRWAIRYWMQ